MTERSILAGINPIVVIKVGGSVTVRGVDSDLVTASTESRWGLKVEKKNEAEFARARAAVGEVVLFDWRFKKPGSQDAAEVIEVQIGASGEVLVPFGSYLKVYSGKDINVQGIRGQVDAFSGFGQTIKDVYCVGNASAGGTLDLDCETLPGEKVEFSAGGDLRFHIHDLTSAHIRVKDLGGFWEAKIGEGQKSVSLKSGGDVTLVTDQKVEPLPPNYILGKIEKISQA
jgi:hypothetical protein